MEKKTRDRIRDIAAAVIITAVPFICMAVSMIMSDAMIAGADIFIYNVLFYVLITAALVFVTRSTAVSAVAVLAVNFIYHVINSLVTASRGLPIVPSDLFAWRTALGVSGNYSLTVDFDMTAGFVISLITAVLAVKLPVRFKKKKTKNIVMMSSSAAAGAICAVLIASINLASIDFSLFDLYWSSRCYGVPLNLYYNFCQMNIKKPDGYSEDDVRTALAEAKDEPQEVTVMKKPPDIIVVMNESFSDILPETGLETDIEPTPFYDSFTENTIHGGILVSTFGGGTCNTEFEFLSGISTGLLPRGTFPYLQYIKQATPTIVSHLKDLGYTARAYHPYWDYSWNRNRIYGYFGFDSFTAASSSAGKNEKTLDDIFAKINYDSFTEPENQYFLRSYISDVCAYDRVERDYEARDKSKPWFSFLVTMQNHGSYRYGDDGTFEPTVHITNPYGDVFDAEQYLSMLNESDKAYERLIEYFSAKEDDVIILFFGDHQPELACIASENSDEPVQSVDRLQQYIAPFKIWANFDIDDADVGLVGAHYLSKLLLDAAGLPQTDSNIYLDDVFNAYPAISVFGAFDASGEWHEWEEVKNTPEINKYSQVMYYRLFAKEQSE